jgi:peptidase M48-like protein
MKIISAIMLIASFLIAPYGQAQCDPANRGKVKVLEPSSLPEGTRTVIANVLQKLKEQTMFKYPQDVGAIITNEPTINACAIPGSRRLQVPLVTLNFFKDNPGELAFLIAHETGHMVDEGCAQSLSQNPNVATRRASEQRADTIGIQFMVGAGYNPFDAAGLMGKFQMLTGRTGLLENFFARFTSDHPIDQDRINNIRNVTMALAQKIQMFERQRQMESLPNIQGKEPAGPETARATENSPSGKARWSGMVVRSDKDASTLTVRNMATTQEMIVHYDSSTKWTTQEGNRV